MSQLPTKSQLLDWIAANPPLTAQRDIASAKEQALADIYSQAASLSTEIAGKILGREISADDQQSLVNASVEQFKQSASSN